MDQVKQTERIPDAELEVMLTLWHSDKPLNVGEITNHMPDSTNLDIQT